MRLRKIVGGLLIGTGLFFGFCIFASYFDGYLGWWRFIPFSLIITIGGIKIWID